MKNDIQRAAISAMIDEIEKTKATIGFDVGQPSDREAWCTVDRIERRLLSIDIRRPMPGDDSWASLGDAALAALKNINPEKGR